MSGNPQRPLTMKIISERTFAKLRRGKLKRSASWWTDSITLPAHYMLPARFGFAALADATRSLISILQAEPPYYVFSNGLVGWKRLSGAKPRSVLAAESPEEIVSTIRKHTHFRGRKLEDYLVTDQTFSWFAVFSHNDTWHLWLTPRLARSKPIQSWIAATRLEALPRWPVRENPDLLPFR